MPLTFQEITHTLGADVASGSSFTVAYPSGTEAADYQGFTGHQLVTRSSVRTLFSDRDEFSVTFGGSDITITINTSDALSEGEIVTLRIGDGT